ncbi:penicillin-binding protein 2 [Patescibacteria group bacterium]|nr:penicillin-binding protein 2 [Patescibacteria group bacterium]MBU1890914.1 penicillin-binding protein 2 [Patescibacteria group bacterium]
MKNNPFSVFGDSDDIKKRAIEDYSFNRNQGDEYRIDDNMNEPLKLHVSPGKLNLLVTLILLGIFLLFIRTGYLQVVRGSYYREMSEENRIRIQYVKPPRGLVYDRNENILVQNVPNFTLQIIPADLPKDIEEREEIISYLAEQLAINKTEISNKIINASSFSYQPIIINEHLDIDTSIKLKIESHKLPGVNISAESNRKYIGGESMSHILGYIGKITDEEIKELDQDSYSLDDVIGKTGIELSYEKKLRGSFGRKHIEVDSLGKIKKVIASEDPVSGQSLILSIDQSYQSKLQEILDNKISELDKKGGAAIAIDPRNGEVLALVTSPEYDNNLFVEGLSKEQYQSLINDENKPLYNRAISGEYPSGSTIKPLIAGAALTEGIINSSTEILSVGGIRIDKWFFPDWKSGGHGLTNVIKALAESVNTFFYVIGGGYEEITGLGVAKIKEYANQFGFGNVLNLDLPGESSGFLPDKEWKERVKNEQWYIGDTYHLAIGQGDLLVTPLQIANMTAIIANGGTYYQPHMISAYIDNDHNTNAVKPNIINNQVLPVEHINTIKRGLREAVISGSAVSLNSLGVSVAGKTGTAQFKEDSTHSWFTCFAPYENPEIVVTVLVEEGGEGHVAALPVAKEFLTWYYGKN